MNRIASIATLTLLASGLAQAETLPNWPMRELAVQADVVVIAAPVDPAAPGQFKAVRVLLGTALKEGDTFEIADFSLYDLTIPISEGASARKPVRTVEAVLFLGPKTAGAPTPRFPLVTSGLRAVTADGAVYRAEQYRNPGGYVLRPYRASLRWDDLLRRAATDAQEVTNVRALKSIADPHRRNVALLDWVERRRREFGGGFALTDGEEPPAGWGSLERSVFDWMLDSRIPADCWAAVKLYAELNQGAAPMLRQPVFGTRAGRDLLSAVAVDESALIGHRVRALELLATIQTLWPTAADGQPPVEPLETKEQNDLIDRVALLLKEPAGALRLAAARTLTDLSAPQAADLQSFHTERALSALTAAYQAERPGEVRGALAEAVYSVGGVKAWESVGKEAQSVLVLLKDPHCRQGTDAYCWLAVERTKDGIGLEPALVLERLDDKEKVVEEKVIPLDGLIARPPQPDGWQAGAVEHFTLSMANFTPGVWRMTAKGVVGPGKAPWKSEPRLLRLAPPPKPGLPNPNPTAPRIVFDP